LTELSRPKLAAKARLRVDRRSGGWMLLTPERGLLLNTSAGEILELCTGRFTVGMIVERLVDRHGKNGREAIVVDVFSLLAALSARGLIEE
jgi:pyrroloquinoline quinone biosynthesis protein D